MRLTLTIYLVFLFCSSQAQTKSLTIYDSLQNLLESPWQRRKDNSKIKKPLLIRFDTAIYNDHTFYSFKNPRIIISGKRDILGKDAFFYVTLGLLFLFALIRQGHSKYLKDLFRIFFRTTMKQRQVKEQLMQRPMPSLLLNILFILASSLFINIVFRHNGIGMQHEFWWLFFYSVIGISIIYLGKFLTLKFFGWLFHMPEPLNAYIFIVFTTNKIIGIALIPLIILLTFSNGMWNQVLFSAVFLLIGGLFLYRFYLTYASIHRQVRVSSFHILIYILALEIAPLLLINKVLFTILL